MKNKEKKTKKKLKKEKKTKREKMKKKEEKMQKAHYFSKILFIFLNTIHNKMVLYL